MWPALQISVKHTSAKLIMRSASNRRRGSDTIKACMKTGRLELDSHWTAAATDLEEVGLPEGLTPKNSFRPKKWTLKFTNLPNLTKWPWPFFRLFDFVQAQIIAKITVRRVSFTDGSDLSYEMLLHCSASKYNIVFIVYLGKGERKRKEKTREDKR